MKNVAEKFNILIVDDRKENLLTLESLIESPELTIIQALSGNEALAVMLEKEIALVLMDVQMPEMDGLEATRALRRREKSTGAHVPIVAMTAYAMKGDRERCLESGMDGYISKPINAQELYETIERVMSALEKEREQVVIPTGTAGALDKTAVLDRVGGDVELLKEIVDLFLETCPGLLEEIREALRKGDPESMEKAAHSLKGSVSNFGAESAAAAALRIERMGRSRDLSVAPVAIMSLEREIDRVREELVALSKELEP